MDNDRIAKRVETWIPNGKRSKGQQKPRWKDAAVGEARLRGAKGRSIEELAQDRTLWKSFHITKGRITDHGGKRVN